MSRGELINAIQCDCGIGICDIKSLNKWGIICLESVSIAPTNICNTKFSKWCNTYRYDPFNHDIYHNIVCIINLRCLPYTICIYIVHCGSSILWCSYGLNCQSGGLLPPPSPLRTRGLLLSVSNGINLFILSCLCQDRNTALLSYSFIALSYGKSMILHLYAS